ncbi:hypothetical protein NUW54_g14171 [Trametes sanguinea]|uniref:Uncharacterized protein n=1 Tax=Trametes sanguinea TaxID=158606 RepID=A0ACC1MGA9_9APHY|nr:hypothetical protein NUW54_g14171 [Trametes sanguinea]
MFAKKAIILALLSLSLSVAAKSKDDTCDAQQAKTVTVTHTVSAAAATGSSVLAAAGGTARARGGNNANKGGNAAASSSAAATATAAAGKGGNNAGNTGFDPVDSILTRMGAYDNMFSNASTFKVELDEWYVQSCSRIEQTNSTSLQLQRILRDATPKVFSSSFDGMSFGRGTSNNDVS